MALIEQQQTQQRGPASPVPPVPPAPPGPPAAQAPPSPEISPIRVALLLIVLIGAAVGIWRLVSGDTSAAGTRSDAVPVYAPYVDVTQTPTYAFQSPSANPVAGVYLGFIVSAHSQACTPSWGAFYTLEQAEQALDLDARTAELRNQGGSVMVSYGGRDNSDLAVGCTDQSKLVEAYMAPIERYHATAIDLDLEGQTLADTSADARRAQAIATVQRQMVGKHASLGVWMTLPVAREGLTAQGVAAVKAMLAAHVKLAGVNAMAMDFGPDEGAVHDMVGTIERALYATHAQVQSLWQAAKLPDGASAAWGHLGVTVMLGVNDAPSQRFTVHDAHALARFVNRHGIPRVSAWSLNRDSECGGAFAQTGVVSNTCSGVLQKPLQFTRILGSLKGTKTARPQSEASSSTQAQHASTSTDDPATSPYPIWRATGAYVSGYKVVWQGEIYEASWWTQSTPPGSLSADAPNGPWQLIGPVPAGSHAPKLVRLTSAKPAPWSPSTVYHEGDKVNFAGLPYQARWYTQGEQPRQEIPSSPGVPWEPLFEYPGEPTNTGSEAGAA
ncbi:MAG TPA: chitinase [Solirubrobacteraceae bacterium]|jgi:chitinase